ncbi:MAG: SBBP repeat-containing protein [Chloroflexota bacterium]
MFKKVCLIFLFLLTSCTGGFIPSEPHTLDRTGSTTPEQAGLPLAFAPNVGQSPAEVLFQAKSAAGTVFFTGGQVWLAFANQAGSVALEFLGHEASAGVSGAQQLEGRANYLIGNDPSGWQTDLPLYAGVRYTDLYPGIDLEYTGQDGRLKGVYTLAPGADPALIRWQYRHADRVSLDAATGDLVIAVGGKTLRELAPIAWQEINGLRRAVAVHFALGKEGTLSFELGPYDPDFPLVIDPYLQYSTYFGGDQYEGGYEIAIDAQGNVYAVGYTTSTNFPGAGQPQPDLAGGSLWGDAFILKLNAAGDRVVYATYLGGGNEDVADSIVLDSSGAVYISGVTWSDDFPTVNAYQPLFNRGTQTCEPTPCADAFVAKLNPAGNSLAFSTYLGGSNADNSGLTEAGDSRGASSGIGLDSAGNVYVTGVTLSMNFPVVNAYDSTIDTGQKAFLSKLSADGQAMLYSTYVGGSTGNVYSGGLLVKSPAQVYVTGMTGGTSFPTRNPLQATSAGEMDAFLAQFDTTQPGDDSLIYSTYFGGSNDDFCFGLAADATGNIYLTGDTLSEDVPMQGAYQDFNASVVASKPIPRDAWVAKISADGSQLLYSTYLGGSDNDLSNGLVVTAQGDVFLAGYTASRDFPIKDYWDARLDTLDQDAFVAHLDSNKAGAESLVYSTYLGGDLSSETAYGLALDAKSHVYVIGETGWRQHYNDGFSFKHILGEDEGSGGFIVRFSPFVYRIYLPLTVR